MKLCANLASRLGSTLQKCDPECDDVLAQYNAAHGILPSVAEPCLSDEDEHARQANGSIQDMPDELMSMDVDEGSWEDSHAEASSRASPSPFQAPDADTDPLPPDQTVFAQLLLSDCMFDVPSNVLARGVSAVKVTGPPADMGSLRSVAQSLQPAVAAFVQGRSLSAIDLSTAFVNSAVHAAQSLSSLAAASEVMTADALVMRHGAMTATLGLEHFVEQLAYPPFESTFHTVSWVAELYSWASSIAKGLDPSAGRPPEQIPFTPSTLDPAFTRAVFLLPLRSGTGSLRFIDTIRRRTAADLVYKALSAWFGLSDELTSHRRNRYYICLSLLHAYGTSLVLLAPVVIRMFEHPFGRQLQTPHRRKRPLTVGHRAQVCNEVTALASSEEPRFRQALADLDELAGLYFEYLALRVPSPDTVAPSVRKPKMPNRQFSLANVENAAEHVVRFLRLAAAVFDPEYMMGQHVMCAAYLASSMDSRFPLRDVAPYRLHATAPGRCLTRENVQSRSGAFSVLIGRLLLAGSPCALAHSVLFQDDKDAEAFRRQHPQYTDTTFVNPSGHTGTTGRSWAHYTHCWENAVTLAEHIRNHGPHVRPSERYTFSQLVRFIRTLRIPTMDPLAAFLIAADLALCDAAPMPTVFELADLCVLGDTRTLGWLGLPHGSALDRAQSHAALHAAVTTQLNQAEMDGWHWDILMFEHVLRKYCDSVPLFVSSHALWAVRSIDRGLCTAAMDALNVVGHGHNWDSPQALAQWLADDQAGEGSSRAVNLLAFLHSQFAPLRV
ncbi:hypothetical protein BD626DRAFT_579138 [Schizophyllum amplum]|uniref:Uncharacterized protein n=1 Tax=Schizophyllum amplum TaxID=97359 RepID=A0A550BRP3_9AGAR|nr:hypothetical protein BD626DRAFT_579138 [Auriculariopsis ampla]